MSGPVLLVLPGPECHPRVAWVPDAAASAPAILMAEGNQMHRSRRVQPPGLEAGAMEKQTLPPLGACPQPPSPPWSLGQLGDLLVPLPEESSRAGAVDS